MCLISDVSPLLNTVPGLKVTKIPRGKKIILVRKLVNVRPGGHHRRSQLSAAGSKVSHS